jgi:autotransporter-associated beta strand protein
VIGRGKQEKCVVNKMYPVKNFRRRRALGLAVSAFGIGLFLDCSQSSGQSVYSGPNFGSWAVAGNWTPTGVPSSGTTVQITKATTVNYTISAPTIDLLGVDIAGGSAGFSAGLQISSNSFLDTDGMLLGSTFFGSGINAPGTVTQLGGTVTIDPGGLFEVDSNSLYSMTSTLATLIANNEILQGTFTENNGSNQLTGGSKLNNQGVYLLTNTAILHADSIVNTGTFNQSGSTSIIQGTTSANGVANASFNNSGSYSYNTGSFTGQMINNAGALVSITGAIIPFTQGIIDNGLMTVFNVSGTGTSPTATYSAPITGTGNLIFSGSSDNVALSGTNSFTGSTSITGGTLALACPVGTASNNFAGGLDGPITIGAAGTLLTNADSQISNAVVLTINGGTLNLGTHNQSVGSLVMNAGQILQASGLGLGITSGSITVNSGSATINGGLRSDKSYNFNVSSALAVNGAITSIAGNASNGLILTGGGTLTISGVSPLKALDIQQGILQLNEGGSFGGVNVSVTAESGGTFSISGQTLLIGDLIGSGAVALGAGNLSIFSTGSTFSGTITGTGSFTKQGSGTFNLTGNDLTSGANTVSAGVMTVGSSGSIGGSSITVSQNATANINGTINNIPAINAFGTINFGATVGSGFLIRTMGPLSLGSEGQVNVAPAPGQANRTLLVPNGMSLSGATNSWAGQVDLSNNDMIVRGGTLATLTNQIRSGFKGGAWTGSGITSSAAAADPTHLTALGVIQNDNGSSQPLYGSGAALGTFDGYTPQVSDVLIKFTYFGDANLDGVVDGSDYSLIDNGFLNKLTGWFNGDFNYDGVVNGSDYTLIDNAFNSQGASFADVPAATTAEIASSSTVPEPAMMGMFSLAAVALLNRCRRR